MMVGWEGNLLRWILVLAGMFLMLAFGATILPIATMATWHRWLGLGDFPNFPLTVYLARSTALLYGVHGVMMFYAGMTWPRYWQWGGLFGWLHVLIGSSMLAIDWTSPMPLYWTVLEGPPVAGLGVLMLALFHRVNRRMADQVEMREIS